MFTAPYTDGDGQLWNLLHETVYSSAQKLVVLKEEKKYRTLSTDLLKP